MRPGVRLLLAASLAGVLSACSSFTTPPTTTLATTTTSSTTTTTPPPRDCTAVPAHPGVLDPSDPVGASVAISEASFPCAHQVVLTSPELAAGVAPLAAERLSPLLLVADAVRGDVAAEIARLDPERLLVVGLDDLDLSVFEGYEVEHPPAPTGSPPPELLEGTSPERVWLVLPDDRSLSGLATAAALTTGDAVVPVDVPDLRAIEGRSRDVLVETAGAPTVWAGAFGEDGEWKLEVVRANLSLPGGGQLLFPGRRVVAFYGNPTTPALGVLGEQGPEATVERMAPIVAEYGADGVPAIPAFEIIATVASAQAGEDGDYSAELSVEEIRPWVEVARQHGVYVILDLQPGRTDFLTQAKRYEELLIEPHVGLALDPEWRLGPEQFHLRQIGSVDAAEVNLVGDWLAGLVREHHLPQKMLLLHQFRFSMITNREAIRIPPELALVVQMDGQGPLGTKYDTWNALLSPPEADRFWWGWKNFYDEDSPMAVPSQVLELDPVPVFVSFQ